MPVRAVTFDADDTLWDFTTVAGEASKVVVDRLRERHPHEVDVDDLVATHRGVVAESPPGSSHVENRRQAIRRFVTEQVGDDTALADELIEVYFEHRHRAVRLFDDVVPMLDALGSDLTLGVVTNGNTRWRESPIAERFSFWLAADQIGVRKPDPRVFRMAAAAAGCHPRDLVHVGDEPDPDVLGARRAGARGVWLNRRGKTTTVGADGEIASLKELPALITHWDALEVEGVGVGPHPEPWPDDPRLDSDLLAGGDRRNVADRYRYWRREAIVEDLDDHRHPFHVAVENWRHDLNIGTVVRTANAFAARAVHIVGERRWNRRGAMVTDRYQHIHHHETIDGLIDWAGGQGLEVVGVDNLPGAESLENAELPEHCVLLFGQEGTGLSEAARGSLDRVLSIRQFGSTRSINAGVAAGIAMHSWVRQHAGGEGTPRA